MSQMSSQTAPEPKGPYLNFVEGFGYAGSGALAALVLMVLVIAAVIPQFRQATRWATI
jgi:hypothetical protein